MSRARDLKEARLPSSGLDPEVEDLCLAMNALPGITTLESCWGHGNSPFRIWFDADPTDPRGLTILVRAVSPRYWEHGWSWSITTYCSDTKPLVTYCLQSTSSPLNSSFYYTTGRKAYEHSRSLVRNIWTHVNHDTFLKSFGLGRPEDYVKRWPGSLPTKWSTSEIL